MIPGDLCCRPWDSGGPFRGRTPAVPTSPALLLLVPGGRLGLAAGLVGVDVDVAAVAAGLDLGSLLALAGFCCWFRCCFLVVL